MRLLTRLFNLRTLALVAIASMFCSSAVTSTAGAATSTPSVTSFTLINADTHTAIRTLSDGATLNFSTLPTRNLNVRANTNPSTVGSVRFGLDLVSNYRTENTSPYALAGNDANNGSKYLAWTPRAGKHTLAGTPYSGRAASGTPGTTLRISFTVVDGTTAPIGSKYDAGLSEEFRNPSVVTGRTRNVLNYGATPGYAADDDAVAFRRAIAAAVAGDEVFAPNGVYHFKTAEVKLKSGVSLRGQSRAGTVVTARLQPSSYAYYDGCLICAKGSDNLTISTFRIERSGGAPMKYGVTVRDSERVRIANLQIEEFDYAGVAVIYNSKHIRIRGNIIKNAANLGTLGNGYGIRVEQGANNVWVSHNVAGPVIRHGYIISYGSHHNLFNRNVAIRNTEDAFDLHGEEEHSNEIRYNVVEGCVDSGYNAGIGIGNGPGHWNAGPNNWVHHNEVHGCNIGLHVEYESHYQYVEDNYLHHNKYGLRIQKYGAKHVTLRRNKVQFNQSGVTLISAEDLVMEDNIVTNNSEYNLDADPATVEYVIKNNDFRASGRGIRLANRNGLFVGNLQ